jgi:hypothetical protein
MKRKRMEHPNECNWTTFLAAGLIALFAIGTPAQAQNANQELKKDPPKKWESVATVGVTLTRGNSDNFLATAAIGTKRSWTKDELLLGASAGYGQTTTSVGGEDQDTTTDSYIRGYGQWNHLFSSQFYAGLRVTGDHDDVADLAYRATVSPLAGYYFIKQTNAFLSAEVGPSYVREKFFYEDVHDYLGLRIGERGEYKFKSGAKIWESLEWIPKVQDMNNYLLIAEAGISAPVSKALSVSLIVQDTFKNVPAPGKLKNDFKLIAGLTYNF